MKPSLSHCPDQNIVLRDFYKALLDKFSLRLILTILARLASNDSKLVKFMLSREILEKILQDPQIGIKDYISWTTKLSELKEKKSLMNFYSEVGEKQPGLWFE